MTHADALKYADTILGLARAPKIDTKNFLEYAATVRDAAKSLNPRQRARLRFRFDEWVYAFRDLYDKYDKLVQADPMLLYTPANQTCLEFHQSQAYIRYFRSGNRCGKTTSGNAEHYFITTGQHRWRNFLPPPASTALVAGLPYSQYAGGVFEKKFLTGEDASPISPIFPVGGKWFYHYDAREYTITIACPPCAEAGKAGTCPHQKSTIQLFSNESGWEVLQGSSRTLIHFDEHVDEDFFSEARQRTKTVPGGCLIVTGTPLHGYEAWEHRRLTQIVNEGPPHNRLDPENPKSVPLVSLHEVDMFKGGLVPHEQIRSEMRLLDKFEIDSRIYGRPAPLAKNPVFDRFALQKMQEKCRDPRRGTLAYDVPTDFKSAMPGVGMTFTEAQDGPLRVWEEPRPGEVYICAVDTAGGLSERTDRREGDASCCAVLRAYTHGNMIALEQVAQWHGWLTPYDYADEVFKVGMWYNVALVVIELTGGLGLAVAQRLKNDHYYMNLYREPRDPASIEMTMDNRIGVQTNVSTKPFMVSALKQYIKEGRLALYCSPTIQELTAFEQESKGAGGAALAQPRYRGAGGAKDDRVMALAIGCSTALTYPALMFEVQHSQENKNSAIIVSTDMQKLYRELEHDRRAGGLDA